LIEIDEEHELLDQIVDAAKKRTEALEELELELQSGDTFDQERAQLVRAVKETSIGPYLRIAHGDIELLGQRDGPFSEFYAQELEE
jgi:hypothetical protein